MEETMEVERCEHCEKFIPSVNFVMHIAHCQRNIKKCGICGEAVSKVNWQEHQEDHKTVKCNLCGKEIPKSRLENHVDNSCLNREVACIYCGLDLSFNKLNEHEIFCGARTEPCETCKKFVMIKDLSNHVCNGPAHGRRNNSSPTFEDVSVETVPCEFCNMQIPIEQLMEHQSSCFVSRRDEDEVEIIDDDDTAKSPRGRKRSHEDEIAEESDSSSEETTDGCPGEDTIMQDNEIYALPCEICGDLCPSDRLMDHQRECFPEKEPHGSTRDVPIYVDEDDDDDDDTGILFNNLNLGDDGPRHHPRHINERLPRLDPFDMMARFHPFFAGPLFDQRFSNQRPRAQIYFL